MPTCKILVEDEVNCKISGLELTVRKRLAEKFKYEIPGARYQPAVRLGRWDGCVSFFSIGGVSYINLLPEIIPMIQNSGYDIELEDTRTYSNTFEFELVTESSFESILWPPGHRLENQPLMLNPHQVEVINNALTNTQSLAIASTGSGKTVVTAALSQRVEKYGRSVIIVPNKSLVTQTEEDYKLFGLDVGVYYGDRKELGKTHTICTWQSLDHLIKRTKNGEEGLTIYEFLEDVVCVICDECHMCKADQLKSMLSNEFAKVPIRWGLTGTVPKEKFAQASLLVCLGHVVSVVKAADLQEAGHLSNCNINVIQLQDYGEFKNYQQELSYLVTTEARLREISKIITKIKETGNTLVLVDRITTGEVLLEMLGDQHAVFVSGSTKNSKRQEEYKNIRCSDDTILIATYGVAAVGISIDRIFNLVMIEPGKSFVRVIQSIGRGLRRATDKDFVNVWDITSSCKYSKRHLTERKKFYRESEYPFVVEKHTWK